MELTPFVELDDNTHFYSAVKVYRVRTKPKSLAFYLGILLLFGTAVFFVLMSYCLFFSKFMPSTGNPILDSLKEDRHYSLMLMGLLPLSVMYSYCRWVSIKIFRHT
eukprot:GCRY01002878.1.p1 GENE.GCRY01002878.1~~GCRY01002878.1.p1  ORF type:complete len:106 (+),score=4.69 GCRY01002878.1:178-495(+)